MRDFKYLLAYTIPFFTLLSLAVQDFWSYGTVLYAFVAIPFLETFLFANNGKNLTEEEREYRASSKVFDWLLYLNFPIILALLIYYLQIVSTTTLATYETIGLTLSMGTMLGACGINVAHELGHRLDKKEQFLAKLFLLPELYMHFFIEHNQGHHKNIATDLDPASAKYGEWLPIFWLRSVIGSYIGAWKLENQRLRKEGKIVLSWNNEMLRFQVIQFAYLATIASVWDVRTMIFAIWIAITAFLLLETINYIEHYGLRRKKLASGRYEHVGVRHSWNSNHEVGRIVLYELTRHSDHHHKATKKYQILDHHDSAPQLPFGYPTSMLIALMPPLWFAIMNKRVKEYMLYINHKPSNK